MGNTLTQQAEPTNDIKMTGLDDEMKSVLQTLSEHFDELKLERDNFEHLGLKHVLESDGSRTISQEHYVKELRFISEAECRNDVEVSPAVCSKFMSLLGGIAWTVQTRPDIAVFTSAVQRKLQPPSGKDVVHLNRVLAYLKRKPLNMT